MTIIEDNEFETIAKSEIDSIREIAEDNSANKVFYIRLSPQDMRKIETGEKIVNVVEDKFRNYIIVLADESEVPNDEYFQELMIEHGKVIAEKAE